MIFLAGKPVCMEDSSSSEALASVRETTPFVRDKQRTREMNYICAIGSRIMKMIDRYLFDIGKFSCHTMFFLYPRQCHPASSCNRCATQIQTLTQSHQFNRDVYLAYLADTLACHIVNFE